MDFEYHRPSTIGEALRLKAQYGRQAIFMAGGTDEMVRMHTERTCPFQHLISLKGLSDLNFIREEDGCLRIGAAATHREIAASALIKSQYAALSDAASQVGSVQIRNVATIGGNVCSALPSADTSAPLLALGAKVKIASAGRGGHLLDLADFFIAPGKSVLLEDEMVLEFVIPAAVSQATGAYCKLGRRKALEIAISAAAVYIRLDPDKRRCEEARFALTTAAPTPLLVKTAAAELVGKPVTEESLTKAGLAAVSEASPRTSFRSAAEYRKAVIPVLVKRAGLVALERVLARQ